MKRENIVWGLVLILLGAAFMANQLFPGLFGGFQWPWILLGLGGLFIIGSLVGRIGGMMVPGVILLTLGGIFLYQTNSGNWESWAYIWALLPAAAGVGMLLGGLYDGELRKARPVAVMMILVGVAAFIVFGAFFTGLFGLSPALFRFWPVVLIIVGVVVLLQSLRRRDEI